jgi:hypothetical protein
MTNMLRGRLATAAASLCLLLAVSAGPASAVLPDDYINDGQGICTNCQPNVKTKTGNATGGSVSDNGDGSANATMTYSVPNDGDVYTGTSQVIVKDANGNTILDLTGTVWNSGDGTPGITGLNGIYVPIGGNVYINVIEHGSINSTRSFSGSFHLQNYQP